MRRSGSKQLKSLNLGWRSLMYEPEAIQKMQSKVCRVETRNAHLAKSWTLTGFKMALRVLLSSFCVELQLSGTPVLAAQVPLQFLRRS